MLRNEAFKKYSANLVFLVGSVYWRGVLNTCSSSAFKGIPQVVFLRRKQSFLRMVQQVLFEGAWLFLLQNVQDILPNLFDTLLARALSIWSQCPVSLVCKIAALW